MNLDAKFALIERVLDFASARSKALAGNLANRDTPGYRRVDVDFGSLVEAAGMTNAKQRKRALAGLRPELVLDRKTPINSRGNNVAMENELTQLMQVSMIHEMAVQMAAGKSSSMRMAISGRTG